ncbi:cytochrome c5 family protein [Cupriavidus sp. IK-TO18]|uniref:c-type cytochrome n=1 Tax=Cupriavidus sp. IK-TO18 TaxID=2782182 RepID=UPI0021056B24|nr:c-type cytochrome [Cupriavidus sp. IK-TO18]
MIRVAFIVSAALFLLSACGDRSQPASPQADAGAYSKSVAAPEINKVSVEQQRIHAIEKYLTDALLKDFKDPDSAKFRQLATYRRYIILKNGEQSTIGYTLCGEVNAKNAMGGYVGYRRFWAYTSASGVLSPDTADRPISVVDNLDFPEPGFSKDCRDESWTEDEYRELVQKRKAKEAEREARLSQVTPKDPNTGRHVYEQVCAACHASGVAGAPKFGDKPDWAHRLSAGSDALHAAALRGKGVMPPKGGYAGPDADVIAASDYMLGAAK